MPITPPTPSEIIQYFDVARDEIRRFGVAPPQSALWHYTSGDGLIAIIESAEFWVTQVSCVNDATEIEYSRLLLRQALINKRQTAPPTPDEIVLYDATIDALATEAAPTSEWFIGCFSIDGDDLAQWRAYGKGEGGYAIGFNTSLLWHCLQLEGAILTKVCYDANIHGQIARSVADATVDYYLRGLAARPGANAREWVDAFLVEWTKAMGYIAPAIKHPNFAGEQEWRILRQLQDADVPNLKFRQRQSMISRHLPLPLRDRTLTAPNDLLPIIGVRVGPARHQGVSRVSVADMLRAKRYPDPIWKNVMISPTPFQVI